MRRPGSILTMLCVAVSALVPSCALASLIHDLAAKGDVAAVQKLIGGEPCLAKAKDSYGATPLHFAVAEGHTALVELLLQAGTDVNAPKNNGVTALHVAASYGRLDIVRVLLKAGASPLMRDRLGRTPVGIAESKGRQDVVDLLNAAETKPTASTRISVPARAEIITNIPPLFIRGTNYFPSATPWSGMWDGNTSPETWDADMARAESLNINTVRTFLLWYGDPALIAADGTPTKLYLDRFEEFLSICWSRGIRVIVCFDHWWKQPEAQWRKAIEAFVQPHRLDGRILMWEIDNEPDLDNAAGLINGSIPLIKSIDPHHHVTVQIDTTKDRQVNKHGLKQFPDIANYHDYYPHKTLWEKRVEAVAVHIRDTISWNDGKPLFLGEFGTGCIGDGSPEAPKDENDQASLYGLKLHGVEQEKALGAANWALVSWTTAGTVDDRTWGTFRQDYTLRPAGELMKQVYARWAHPQRYAYYDECHSDKPWSRLSNGVIDDLHPDDSLLRQRIETGQNSVAVSDAFETDAAAMSSLEIAVNNVSEGVAAHALLIDVASSRAVATLPMMEKPGLYRTEIALSAGSATGMRQYQIKLVLNGATGGYIVWDRVAITSNR